MSSREFRATQQHYQDCRLWCDIGSQGQDIRTLSKDKRDAFVNVETTISQNVTYHKFLTSVKGLVGIGPPGIKGRDKVWIVCAGEVPLLLRLYKETFSPPNLDLMDHSCYTLVGDCYVDDIMNEEVAPAWETDESSTDLFLI